MMKGILAAVVMTAGMTAGAMAACTGGFLNGNAVVSLVRGNTVCSPASCAGTGAGANCGWQEFHQGVSPATSGTLIELHSGTAADPQETVGTWSVATTGPSNGKITYNYGTGGTFIYDVHNNGANHSLCGTNGEFTFTVKAGSSRCP